MYFCLANSNIYKFLYNVTCQISETWLFSDVAPVIIGQNLSFLFYKNAETKECDAYKAITAVLNNNILNFYARYGVDFHKHFESKLAIRSERLVNENFYIFPIKKDIQTDSIRKFKTKFGQTISYRYVLLPENATGIIYRYNQSSYNREKVSLNDKSSLANDRVISLRDRLKRLRYSIFLNNEEDITLINLKMICLISASPSNESEIAFTIIQICLYCSLPTDSLMKETVQFLAFLARPRDHPPRHNPLDPLYTCFEV